jgi:hypothetical protein
VQRKDVYSQNIYFSYAWENQTVAFIEHLILLNNNSTRLSSGLLGEKLGYPDRPISKQFMPCQKQKNPGGGGEEEEEPGANKEKVENVLIV